MITARMHETRIGECAGSGNAPGVAGWLGLAAAPTFGVMALVSAVDGNGSFDAFCPAGHGGFAVTGMTAMYALMSVFHAAPWLRLISRNWRRSAVAGNRAR